MDVLWAKKKYVEEQQSRFELQAESACGNNVRMNLLTRGFSERTIDTLAYISTQSRSRTARSCHFSVDVNLISTAEKFNENRDWQETVKKEFPMQTNSNIQENFSFLHLNRLKLAASLVFSWTPCRSRGCFKNEDNFPPDVQNSFASDLLRLPTLNYWILLAFRPIFSAFKAAACNLIYLMFAFELSISRCHSIIFWK